MQSLQSMPSVLRLSTAYNKIICATPRSYMHKSAAPSESNEYERYIAPKLVSPNNPSALAKLLPTSVAVWVQEQLRHMKPSNVYVMDGSAQEQRILLEHMHSIGMTKRLPKYDNCWLTRTDPADVARVESKTFMVTHSKRQAVAPVAAGAAEGMLGNWMDPGTHDELVKTRMEGCMKGRTMYVVPFSMGLPGGHMSKVGIELTDSPYVAASMRTMTHMGPATMDALRTAVQSDEGFVRCNHSVGQPIPMARYPAFDWPCNPSQTFIAHDVDRMTINSFGSGYGGNSLLGKKCMALRLGSIMAREQGWLAEHMLIIGVTPPNGKKRYIAAAFPSACGKTNLAMMLPALKGYKVECVGDDIAWMRFGADGRLWAMNPENGFFGVAPGTSRETNPIAMQSIQKDTLFTNVAETSDGGFYWEGMEKELSSSLTVTDWQSRLWNDTCKTPAAHPNSRFCMPARNLATLDEGFYSDAGVPIDAIMFGGRRPHGVPLVSEAFDWAHGVYYGAAMRSESTAAAEHKGKSIMHDPFAMRPFFGYNFGDYLKHWLSMPSRHSNARMPKVFNVNWFRKGAAGEYLWPGFGDNIRVLDWVLKRCDDADNALAVRTPIGYVPKREHFNLSGMDKDIDWEHLFTVDKEFYASETAAVAKFLRDNVGEDVPAEVWRQSDALTQRLSDTN